ncbi:MAG: BatA domain-containing protein, partial [Planctomycetota bacterium]|nr:BatA domain-containing protein [Planctomycetota bacterium]
MLSFANPWGLLALLAVPAILAIHLYRRRFPRLVVAGAFLWAGETEVRDAGRTRDRLPITATLLLELLAAILLALVLSQPRFGASGRVAHLVA